MFMSDDRSRSVVWHFGRGKAISSDPAIRKKIQARAKKLSPCLKFPPQFCQAKWPAYAQPIGPDGTCLTKLSPLFFARPCISHLLERKPCPSQIARKPCKLTRSSPFCAQKSHGTEGLFCYKAITLKIKHSHICAPL